MRSAIVPSRRLFSNKEMFKHWNQSGCVRGIWCPLQISQWPWCREGKCGTTMFFQVHPWWGFGLYSCKEDLGKYLALKVLANKELGECCILQNCLDIIAWLMRLSFFSPSPPLLFGWQILSQLTKCYFLVSRSCSHRKALVTASDLLQTVSRILKQEKVYKGMACRTDEIKSGFASLGKQFGLPIFEAFFCTLSIMSSKSATLLPLSLKLIPRYLLGFWTRFTWRERAKDS